MHNCCPLLPGTTELPLPALRAHIGRFPISHLDGTPRVRHPLVVIVHAIIDLRSSPDHPLGDAVETFVRREDAERFVEEVRGDDPELASYLRIEERELEAGGQN